MEVRSIPLTIERPQFWVWHPISRTLTPIAFSADCLTAVVNPHEREDVRQDIQLRPCSPETDKSQQWSFVGDAWPKQIKSEVANICIDSATGAEREPLRLMSCNDNPYQRFTVRLVEDEWTDDGSIALETMGNDEDQ